ncbi:MAG: AAA family ATPase, partial [Candidatus Methanomethylicaceae archaeon]
FFDERLVGLTAKDLEKVLQAFYELYSPNVDLLFFDEIQQVKGWEGFISRLRTSKRVIITGSSSQLLSGELSTYLAGRHIDFELYPFNFKEFLEINGVELTEDWEYSSKQISIIKNNLEEFFRDRRFPRNSQVR